MMMKRYATIFIVISMVFVCSGCQKEKTYAEIKKEEEEKVSLKRVEKMSTIKKLDGWYYYFLVTSLGEDVKDTYAFNGCNLKYSNLEGYNILLTDQNNEIVGRLPAHPTLAVSEKEKNGIKERDEIRMITSYFSEKEFPKVIDLNQLNDFETKNFEKEELIKLYNEVQKEKWIYKYGRYSWNDCGIKAESSTKDGKLFQLGYLMSWGNFKHVSLDVKYGDNKFLSDIILENKASEEEKKLYQSFKIIEEYIIESQSLDIASQFKEYDSDLYKRLFTFLKSLEEEK